MVENSHQILEIAGWLRHTSAGGAHEVVCFSSLVAPGKIWMGKTENNRYW